MQFDELTQELQRRTATTPSQFENPATFDGHLRIYPTLSCNLRCAYCVNEEMGQRPHIYREAPPEKWVAAINREQRHVVLTGGEPFLYKGLADLINGVDPALAVRVYSNFCLDVRDHLKALARPVHFYLSWHPQPRADRELFLKNVLAMQANPLFTADIHAIDAPESATTLKADLQFFADQGVPIALDTDQRTFEGAGQHFRALAACSKTIYLIGPDGTRFQCVSRLIRNDLPMENLFETSLGKEESVSECPDFGNCAPCDCLGQTRMAIFR